MGAAGEEDVLSFLTAEVVCSLVMMVVFLLFALWWSKSAMKEAALLEVRDLSSRPISLDEMIIGTSPLGGIGRCMSDEEAESIVSYAVERGFRLFDTAPLYGLGAAERRLGEGLRRGAKKCNLSLAKDVKVWTKVGRLVRKEQDNADVEEATRPENGIYLDCDATDVLVLDYSAEGARISRDDSRRRLGPDIVIQGLRVHDPETPDREAAALAGSLPGLREMGDVEVSLGCNVAGVALRLIGSIDSLMLAGQFNLLDQSGAAVLKECARRGIEVHLAGVFASGLLAGGTTYAYQPALTKHHDLARRWADLAASYDIEDLKTVALAFAFLPSAVSKVALGIQSKDHVDDTLRLIQEAGTVPMALWREAVILGLLPHGILSL